MKSEQGEITDAYPDVLAISSDGHRRLIISNDMPPARQWIVQRRQPSGSWIAESYCQSKTGLRMFAGEFADVVETLPEWCPQRAVPRRVRPPRAT